MLGPEPPGAGDHRPDQRDRPRQLHLLPRLLPRRAQEVPGGGPAAVQTKHVQGEKLDKYTQSFYLPCIVPPISCQVLCGTKPFSDKFKAKKYKLQDQFLMKKDFVYIMKNLPEEVFQYLNERRIISFVITYNTPSILSLIECKLKIRNTSV